MDAYCGAGLFVLTPRPALQTICQDPALSRLDPLYDTQRSSTASCSVSFRAGDVGVALQRCRRISSLTFLL
jgi:hypothetical protein